MNAIGQVSSSNSYSHQRATNNTQASGNSPDLRVLHDFFQSLLIPGSRGGATSPTPTRTNASNMEIAHPPTVVDSSLFDENCAKVDQE